MLIEQIFKTDIQIIKYLSTIIIFRTKMSIFNKHNMRAKVLCRTEKWDDLEKLIESHIGEIENEFKDDTEHMILLKERLKVYCGVLRLAKSHIPIIKNMIGKNEEQFKDNVETLNKQLDNAAKEIAGIHDALMGLDIGHKFLELEQN